MLRVNAKGSTKSQRIGNHDFIFDADGVREEVWGYNRSNVLTFLTFVGYILTVGTLRLLFHWFPHWQLYATHRLSSLAHCQQVLVKDQYKRFTVVEVHIVTRDGTHVKVMFPDNANHLETVKVHNEHVMQNVAQNGDVGSPTARTPLLDSAQDSSLIRHFFYKKLKYVWSSEMQNFQMLPSWDVAKLSQFHEAKPLDGITFRRRQVEFGDNNIPIPVTPIFDLLLKEGLTPFYLFQVMSCILWYLDDYWMYASCIVIISVSSLASLIYDIHKNEKTLREKVTSTGTVFVSRNLDNYFEEVDSTAIVPGDIIEIPKGGCMMYCDAILLSGNCIVNESMLTGESVPVTKTPLPNPIRRKKGATHSILDNASRLHAVLNHSDDELFCMKKHARHVLFCGTKVIQTRQYEGDKVRAVVSRTGFSTAKGDLVRSILFPKPLEFKFTRDALRFVMFMALLALFGFAYTVYIMLYRGATIKMLILRSLDLVTIVVPPALPMAMLCGVIFAQRRLKRSNIYCISPNTINVCGVINVVCFDKTGTLTEEGLDLWGIIPMEKSGQFGSHEKDPSTLPFQDPLLECMATCHSLTCIDGELSGDPLDLIMFQALHWDFLEEGDENNKFGMAVPIVVRPTDSEIARQKNYEIAILRQFTFSSSLQRMSVITRKLDSTHFTLFLKGAPEMVQSLCRADTMPRNYHSVLLQYTREGYRVLALAWRPLKISYLKMQRIQREEVEKDLRFLGLLILENRLKPETTPAIETLKNANIRPVMVTGDNMLTALSVARDCDLIEEFEKIIVVTAQPPVRLHETNPKNGNPFPNSGAILNGVNSNTVSPSDMEHLVEFYYAEDLQKPVTEITAAKIQRHLQRTNSQAMLRQLTAFPATLNEFTIRMMDRPDFHLAMSGKTWSVINEYCPQLIPKLVVKGTVFSRFSPDQKGQLVESLQRLGYFVAMCGDGANDCGALKAAHAGISLSETEASVASPFTSKRQDISCVPDLIREGRCALATSFGIFKFMAGYSLTQFVAVLILYWVGDNLSDFQFLYIDLIMIASLSITFCYTGPYHRLSIDPPPVRLVSIVTILSIIFQMLVHIAAQTTAYVYITNQPWFLPFILVPDEKITGSMSNTAVFIVSAFQYIVTAIVFSKGPPYRQTIVQNHLFLINIVILVAVTCYASIYPFQWLQTLFDLVEYPSLYPRIVLLAIALANFLLAYLVQLVVDGVAFRHRLRRIKRALFPKMFSHKEYERIREEIDRSRSWPPVTRSASVQDMRPEIFGDAVTTNIPQRTDEPLHRSHSADPSTMKQMIHRTYLSSVVNETLSSTTEEEDEDAAPSPVITGENSSEALIKFTREAASSSPKTSSPKPNVLTETGNDRAPQLSSPASSRSTTASPVAIYENPTFSGH